MSEGQCSTLGAVVSIWRTISGGGGVSCRRLWYYRSVRVRDCGAISRSGLF